MGWLLGVVLRAEVDVAVCFLLIYMMPAVWQGA